jgi:AcrR family transcriptional regulator
VSTANQTHAQILLLAEDHMMRRGYHAFSFGDIARVLGVKPAAIHYYYPSKAELAVAVIASYGARFDAWVEATRGWTPAERLVGYFEIGRRFALDGRVCPLSMVIAQKEAVPEPVVAAVRGLQARILGFYVATLHEARAAGQARFDGSAEDQGALVACALIGAQLLARIQGPEAFVHVLRQQARAIGLDVPWPAPSPSERSPA